MIKRKRMYHRRYEKLCLGLRGLQQEEEEGIEEVNLSL
jgi:hypothetical protein